MENIQSEAGLEGTEEMQLNFIDESLNLWGFSFLSI